MSKKENIVLFSGGFDSTNLLRYIKRQTGSYDSVIALLMDYGQVNSLELQVAKKFLKKESVVHVMFDVSSLFKEFQSALLKNKHLKIPETYNPNEQPETYVPNRNLIFISIAIAFAESINAKTIWTAIQPHVDYYYWDAKADFVDKLNELLSLNPTKIKIEAPFKNMTKGDIMALGLLSKEEMKQTLSCYNPKVIRVDGKLMVISCGKCGSCLERQKFGIPETCVEL